MQSMRTVFPAFSLLAALALGGPVRLAAAALPAGAPGPGASHPADDRPGQTGFLDIESDPPAKITIDDSETGKVTPQHLELPAGHHKLTLVTKDGAHKRTLGFNIQAGQTTKLTLHLSS